MSDGLQALPDTERSAPPLTDGPSRIGPLRPVEVGLAGVLALVGLAVLARTATGAYLYAPFADVIDWSARVLQAERDHRWLAYVWDPHTAQRIPLARLVEAFDIETARGRLPSFLFATAVAWLCGLGALGVLIARSGLQGSGRVWVTAMAGLLATNVGLAEDFAFPVFSVYLMVAGPLLAAACLLQLAPREGRGGPAFWSAVAMAALASGGNAAGLAVWPALILVASLQGRDRRQLGALLVAAVIVGGVIEAGLDAPSSSLGRYPDTAVAHLAKVATYFGVFGGLPWTRSVRGFGPAALLGAGVWVLAAVGLIKASPRREDRSAALAGCGVALIVSAFTAAMLASVGRVDEMPQPIVPTRYTPFAVLLQLGVLLSFTRQLAAAFTSPWRGRLIAAALALLVISHDAHGSRALLRASARVRAASETFDLTGRQDAILIYPVAAKATEVRRQLAARGLPH